MDKILKILPVLFLAALIPLLAQATPPVGERLDQALESPLTADPVRFNSTSLTTTILPAIATDITAKTDDRVQLFVVTNLDTANNVCFGTTAWVGANTCATQCTASSINCTAGDANMGSVVTPGSSRQFRYAGTRCACVVASAASTDVQVERVIR